MALTVTTPVYFITNISSGVVGLSSSTLNVGQIIQVSSLTPDILTAYDKGLVSISPVPVSIQNKTTSLTNSTTGSATVNNNALVAITDYADLDNNFALVLLQLNNLKAQIDALSNIVASMPSGSAV
jgi:hypothetical protein